MQLRVGQPNPMLGRSLLQLHLSLLFDFSYKPFIALITCMGDRVIRKSPSI